MSSATANGNGEAAEPRILVVANRTCPCPALIEEVARRAAGGGARVLIVAPALNARLRDWVSEVDGGRAEAEERLGQAVAGLAERGVLAEGRVGDCDPIRAIDDALAVFAADQIIISSHPPVPGRSNWNDKGLIERARERYEAPITHLVSRYGLEPAGATR